MKSLQEMIKNDDPIPNSPDPAPVPMFGHEKCTECGADVFPISVGALEYPGGPEEPNIKYARLRIRVGCLNCGKTEGFRLGSCVDENYVTKFLASKFAIPLM